MSNATTLTGVNPLPSFTWNYLGLNEQTVELPAVAAGTADAIEVSVPAGVNTITCDEFNAVFEANVHPEMAARPAGGLGPEALEWLRANKTVGTMIEVPAGFSAAEPLLIRIKAADGIVLASRLNIIAREGATFNVVVEATSDAVGSGIVGNVVNVFAEANAKVNVTTLQTLDAGWFYLDNLAARIGNDAQVNVQQTILGSQEGYLGLTVALEGFRSDFNINTDYLTTADHKLDFNYLIRHLGKQTTCNYTANGVMTGESHKNLRGTIDLVRGAKGSVGNELESVLLTNKKVRNKSLPIILCDEDDVQGNHGATIGNIAPSQLRYLNARGLSDEQAEALFTRSVFEKAELGAYDEVSRAAVEHLAQTVFDSEGAFIEAGRN